MRQLLATSRQSGNLHPENRPILVIGASSKAPRLGLLLSRGLDNHDLAALRQALPLLARIAAQNYRLRWHIAYLKAKKVLEQLIIPHCETCLGRRIVIKSVESGVWGVCGTCDGSGDRRLELDERVYALALASLARVRDATKAGLAE